MNEEIKKKHEEAFIVGVEFGHRLAKQQAQVLIEALEFYAIEFSHYNNAAEALDAYNKLVGDSENE